MPCEKCLLLNKNNYKTKKTITKIILKELKELEKDKCLKVITARRFGNPSGYLLEKIEEQFKNEKIKLRFLKVRETEDYVIRFWKF